MISAWSWPQGPSWPKALGSGCPYRAGVGGEEAARGSEWSRHDGDIALLDDAPSRVAVVHKRSEFGPLLTVLCPLATGSN
jgi:hypothetical protein